MEVKIITIHDSKDQLISTYKNGSKIIEDYVNHGWKIEQMCSTGVKGELAVMLTRNKKNLINE